jgi:hypothetical protein
MPQNLKARVDLAQNLGVALVLLGVDLVWHLIIRVLVVGSTGLIGVGVISSLGCIRLHERDTLFSLIRWVAVLDVLACGRL